MTTAEQNAFKLVFPKEVFDWFDIVESRADENNVYIVFEEKNLPPLAEKYKKAIPKGFAEITITDFGSYAIYGSSQIALSPETERISCRGLL